MKYFEAWFLTVQYMKASETLKQPINDGINIVEFKIGVDAEIKKLRSQQ